LFRLTFDPPLYVAPRLLYLCPPANRGSLICYAWFSYRLRFSSSMPLQRRR